jgi:hypothetical protein
MADDHAADGTAADGDDDEPDDGAASDGAPEEALAEDDPRAHLADVDDGCGCAEVWERLSEQRRE